MRNQGQNLQPIRDFDMADDDSDASRTTPEDQERDSAIVEDFTDGEADASPVMPHQKGLTSAQHLMEQETVEVKPKQLSPRVKSKHVVVKTKEEAFHEYAMERRGQDFPRHVYFGWKRHDHLEGKQRDKDNKVRTSRYTDANWVPLALFNQLKKLANIYFLVVTLLAFIPNSPKSPGSSILTLTISLIFLVIKDGREDKQRRLNDMHDNQDPANVYQYAYIAFMEKPKQDIRVGDVITVFNN